jgi:sialate O-acetylesterase
MPLPFLSPVFSDHMVLQRDTTDVVWGWTTPGAHVTVTVGGAQGSAVAGRDGKWTARFRAPETGGPYTMVVEGPQRRELEDVLVGDVWLCSGQSNMEMGLGAITSGLAELQTLTEDPELRVCQVPHNPALTPVAFTDAQWRRATQAGLSYGAPGAWSGFSAVAYYFGKALRKEVGVPIGLVQSTWGGTVAEAWTSEPALRKLGDFDRDLASVAARRSQKHVAYTDVLRAWLTAHDSMEPTAHRGAFQPFRVERMPQPFETIGLHDFDGIVWFWREFELDEVPTGSVTLHLGPVDDIDTTYINGQFVGQSWVWDQPRNYSIPAGCLHKGTNLVAVRVVDTQQGGGFSASTDPFGFSWTGGSLSLKGDWKYSVGKPMQELAGLPPDLEGTPNIPTVLSNGMIEPLVPLALKGTIWYQGESNNGRGEQYRRLMPALIGDWRARFRSPLDFYIVQLAAFDDKGARTPDAWPEVREAQALTANTVPGTGLAVAIDIGDRNDIHPQNKSEVGRRLALAALHGTYGRTNAYSGPVATQVERRGEQMVVRFDHTYLGLASEGPVKGFEVAGKDKKFVAAEARIEGSSVVVHAPGVREPAYVRYAWHMAPEASLKNGAGLPAVPFRTDGKVPFNRH